VNADLRRAWPYLPAFRAVAETEHLPTAAEALGTTPSSLSRAVSQLEHELGYAVFDRTGRALRLNEAGRRLLAAVQAAMRSVDVAVRPTQAVGPLRIAATMAMIEVLVLPALARLRAEHPGVVPHLLAPGPSDAMNDALLDGRLDLALLEHPRHHDDLEARRLLDLDYGVYCGPGHALYDRPDAGVDEVLAWPFAGPTVEEADRFPPELRRNVTLRVYQMSVAIAFAASGEYLAVLPRRVVDAWPGARLWRVPGIKLPPGTLYVVTRARPSAAASTLEAILRMAGSTKGTPKPGVP
jgi:DNA-binding transcriptional LysR family regulator